MFERPQHGERAILLHVGIGHPVSEEDCEEFAALAESAGADIVGSLSATRQTATPRFLIGSGKLDELQALVEAADAELVLVDHELSPRQEKNLEKALPHAITYNTQTKFQNPHMVYRQITIMADLGEIKEALELLSKWKTLPNVDPKAALSIEQKLRAILRK